VNHLEQQVAQLVAQCIHLAGSGIVAEGVDGLDHLVGLLDRVAGEALVGLLAVPRALLPQRPHGPAETL